MNPDRELSRLRYLQAMGIRPLVAHRSLPGARVSQRLRLREPLVAPERSREAGVSAETMVRHDASGAQPSFGHSRSATGGVSRTLRDSLSTPAPQPDSTGGGRTLRSAAPGSGEESLTASESFSLAMLCAARRLWIEDLNGSALAREQVDLVAAMAAALEHPQTSRERPRIAQFNWPMHSNMQLDLGPEEAQASLLSFSQRQLIETRCSAVVCLGDAAAKRISALALDVPVLCLPSTRELLAEPQRKRDAWAALRV